MIDDDDLRTRLRSELAPLADPSAALEGVARRARRIRVRRVGGFALAAVVVAAGIAVPLSLLAGVGSGERPPARVAAAGPMHRFGIEVVIPPGWDGRLFQVGDYRFLAAANYPLESTYDGILAQREHLEPDDVLVTMTEQTAICPCPTYRPAELPLQVGPDDATSEFEGVNPAHAYFNRSVVVQGRSFSLWVELGTTPAPPGGVDAANRVLASIQVAADPGWSVHVDEDDHYEVQAPAGWTLREDPVPNLAEPRVLFAAGSWDFPAGGECGPEDALREMPDDGALVWLQEYARPERFDDFTLPRPSTLELSGDPVTTECASGRPSYIVRFVDDWRYLQFQVALGPSASAETRQDAADVMNSLLMRPQPPEVVLHKYLSICERIRWVQCPFSDWVRNTIWDAGLLVRGATDSAIVGYSGRDPTIPDFWMWTTAVTEQPPPGGFSPVASVDGTDVYFDGTRYEWTVRGIDVWLQRATSGELPADVIEPLVRHSRTVGF